MENGRSDRCGAADLIRNGENGYVFRSGDASDLRHCLHGFLSQRVRWERFRESAIAMGRQISLEAVIPYLIRCMQHMTGRLQERPRPPWMQAALVSEAL